MSHEIRAVCRFLLICILITYAHEAAAQVVISEIAWMGTATDANDEWVELQNRGTDTVNLTGWTLSDGDALSITLSGTLAGHEFALLERTDDASVPGVSAFQVYSGALANGGRTLQLKDASGARMDTVTGGTDWKAIGGDNVSKDTPQRTEGDIWITGTPTPGAPTAANGASIEAEEDSIPSMNRSSRTSSEGRTVVHKASALPPEEPTELMLAISAPAVAYVNQPVDFKLSAQGPGRTILNSLTYEWNFGDIFTSILKEPTHAFAYPGEYVVIADAQYATQAAVARHEITILPASLTLTRGAPGELMVTNRSPEEVDIGRFTLQGTASLVFPKHTILKAGRTLRVPSERIGDLSSVVLFDAAHARVAFLTDPHPILQSSSQPVRVIDAVSSPTSSTMVEEEEPEIPTGVIHIGAAAPETPEKGVVARFFRKLGSILRF